MITTLRLVTQSALLQKQRSVTLLNGLAGAGQVVEAARLQAIAASLSAVDAEEAKTAAELARDAAQAGANVYASTAAGLAAVADGVQFMVLSGNEIIRYTRTNSTTATELARYPAASAVQKPVWAGKVNGWFDPFFRRLDLVNQAYFGRDRWYNSGSNAIAFEGWSLISNPQFNGNALRRTAGYNNTTLSGPLIYLDEIGAVAGDTVTAYMLFTGTGGIVTLAYRFEKADGSITGFSAGTGVNASGGGTLTTSGTPAWLKVEVTIPADAAKLRLYPYTASGSLGFDLIAAWAFKGAAASGPSWPSLDDSYFSLRDSEIETRLDSVESGVAALQAGAISANAGHQLRNAYVPYVTWESARGDAEMAGDGEYTGARVAGSAEQATEDTLFNAIQFRVWAASGSTDVEWRVWIRDSKASFDTTAVAPAASGTIAAGSFPTSNTLYKLVLPSALKAAAGKWVCFLFRAADGSIIKVRKWAYDAGVSPARHGFLFSTTTGGWVTSFTEGTHTLGFGATAAKLLLESEEIRRASGVAAASAVTYSGTTSGLSGTTAQQAIDELAGGVDLVVPPTIYALQGYEANVYLDSLYLGNDWRDVAWNVDTTASQTGQQQNERFTITPTGAITTGNLTFAAHDGRTGRLLSSKTAAIRAAASTAGSGLTKKVLVIGDSLINAGVITQRLLDNAATDSMGVTLLGTRGTAPNLREGRGGWTVSTYTTAGPTYYAFTVSGVTTPPAISATYTNNGQTFTVQEVALTGGAGTITCSATGAPAASGTLTKSNGSAGDATITFSSVISQPGNPFWVGGALNFAGYLSANSIATPDWVFIQLGTNECLGTFGTDDASITINVNTQLDGLDTLVANIKAADAGIKVALVIPPPPSFDQDAFGSNYQCALTRWLFKRRVTIWARRMIARYTGQEASRIYLVPSNTALDTVNNMLRATSAAVNSHSSVTATRQNNGVHPATEGYRQLGDAWWAFLKVNA